jgi:predicted nucleic acid-binding protein
MDPLAYFEVDKHTWIHAGELAANAAARGYRLEIGDGVLAALALREGCSVYSLDPDFERIPGLKLHRARTV